VGALVWPSAAVPTEDGDVWRWELPTVHDASRVRMDLRARLAHPSLASRSTEDAREGLLLVFEELSSNALRHGGGSVVALIVALPTGWLIVLTDGAPDNPPQPAVDRDPA
jgi:signal transduction histidine kinase